jgi:hypothetical protein
LENILRENQKTVVKLSYAMKPRGEGGKPAKIERGHCLHILFEMLAAKSASIEDYVRYFNAVGFIGNPSGFGEGVISAYQLICSPAEIRPSSASDRSATKAQLRNFYAELGAMSETLLAPNPDLFPKFKQQSDDALNQMVEWIRQNMAEGAVSRFLDRSGMTYDFRFSNAFNETHNMMLTHYTRFRQNLLSLIESDAWDKPQS